MKIKGIKTKFDHCKFHFQIILFHCLFTCILIPLSFELIFLHWYESGTYYRLEEPYIISYYIIHFVPHAFYLV